MKITAFAKVEKGQYEAFGKFINEVRERPFNDNLMNVIFTEIMLKSSDINENLILPRYYTQGVWYNGEYHRQAAHIKDLLPKKALLQLKELVIEGSKLNFKSKAELKNWIGSVTGINDCSLASTE